MPRTIPITAILEATGGERQPPYQMAPQFIRQLWVVVTKPMFAIEAAADDMGGGMPDVRATKLAEQLKAQGDLLVKLQQARRGFARHFYALAGYRGRVYTTFEGDTDDNAYWEFGGARDDAALFTAQGGLVMDLVQEPQPNTGQSADRVAGAGDPGRRRQDHLQSPGRPPHPDRGRADRGRAQQHAHHPHARAAESGAAGGAEGQPGT